LWFSGFDEQEAGDVDVLGAGLVINMLLLALASFVMIG
jgi:hypothetical protein